MSDHDANIRLEPHEHLRLQFASLRKEPSFYIAIGRWQEAWGRDDDYTCEEIEKQLFDLLDANRLPCPSSTCIVCGLVKPQLPRGDICSECKDRDERERERNRAWEQQWEAMSEDERNDHRRAVAFCISGLIYRDVQ